MKFSASFREHHRARPSGQLFGQGAFARVRWLRLGANAEKNEHSGGV
jgi:hypothetical protein